jgi:20S proteasome alpha/beta subunit
VTCCVAALAEESRVLMLMSDRMIGTDAIAGEPDIRKAIQIHQDWWVQFAGTVPIAVDVVARIKAKMVGDTLSANETAVIVRSVMMDRWAEDSEASVLIPHGWTNATFRSNSNGNLPDEQIRDLDQQRSWHEMGLSLLVSGFDKDGVGHIFSIAGSGGSKFMVLHHDLPGYWAIGTGASGALFMMNYKDVSATLPAREVLYYTLEGKFFGELGSNVGWETDVHILRHRTETIMLAEEAVDTVFEKIFTPYLRPRHIRSNRRAVDAINKLEGLAAFGTLETFDDEEKRSKADKAKTQTGTSRRAGH